MGLSGSKNDLRETLAQCAVLIHLRKPKIGNRLFAERRQDFRLADFASTKLFKQLGGFFGSHNGQYGWLPDFLQQNFINLKNNNYNGDWDLNALCLSL